MSNSIIKDKNIITLTIDYNGKERTYILDINEGCMVNSRGREITSKPQGFVPTNYGLTRELQEFSKTFPLLSYIFNRAQNNYLKFDAIYKCLPIAEKIDALGIKELQRSISNCEYYSALSHIKEIGLKPFLNWAKEKRYYFDYRMFAEFIRETRLYSIIPKEKVEKLDNFSKSMILNIIDYMDSIEELSKYYQKILYYIENDHYIKYAKFNTSPYEASKIFYNMLKFAITLKCEIPKTKSIFEAHNILQKNYNVWKDTKDNKALAENQNKDYLNFAFGNYVVVVPTTAEEFRKEAFEQNNCVYSSYMSQVIKGITNVVFIRKADRVDKSFITCEVKPNGQIAQYLLANNRRVEDSELLELKNLYQNHIFNNINK